MIKTCFIDFTILTSSCFIVSKVVLMGKEEFLNCWLDRILIKSKSKAFKGSHGFVSTFEVLKQYFKCSDVKFSTINPLDVLRNLPKTVSRKSSISGVWQGFDYVYKTSQQNPNSFFSVKLIFQLRDIRISL